jgi:hypothetical protein
MTFRNLPRVSDLLDRPEARVVDRHDVVHVVHDYPSEVGGEHGRHGTTRCWERFDWKGRVNIMGEYTYPMSQTETLPVSCMMCIGIGPPVTRRGPR